MGKTLKIFVGINLILSLGIIALGFLSFGDRKVLKAEAVELEQTLSKLSADLQWGEEVAWENPDERKTISFNFSQPASAAELSNLGSELDPLARFATQRQAQLSQRYEELTQNKRLVAETRESLETREKELTVAKNQVESLQAELSKVNQEVAEIRRKINSFETEISSRKPQITTKNDTLMNLNNEIASLEIDLETRIQERDNAQAEYDQCRIGAAGEQTQQSKDAKGKKGLVLAVNKQWEYVVLDKGDANISPDYQAFVHRGNEFVAKLNILRVEENLAVAEIVTDTIPEGQSIQPGDSLFF
ncbi:MAG: hypothetical protein ACO3N7_11560 [Kiritimatiellia bacterium]